MYGRYAIWFPLTLLALLVALTTWIDRTVQPPEPKKDGSSRHDADYTISHFVTTQTDINGNVKQMLAAAELVHYPDDDSTALTRPRFTQYGQNKPYTQIQGQRGEVSKGGDQVYFRDQVMVVRGAMPGRPEMQVLTEYLHITPEAETADTDHPVSILQAPHTVIRAQGMHYDKKAKTVQLAGRVRVHYERPGPGAQALSAPPPLTAQRVSSRVVVPVGAPQPIAPIPPVVPVVQPSAVNKPPVKPVATPKVTPSRASAKPAKSEHKTRSRNRIKNRRHHAKAAR